MPTQAHKTHLPNRADVGIGPYERKFMNQKDQHTFDLEDIVREFGGGSSQDPEDTLRLEDASQHTVALGPEEDVKEYVPKAKAKPVQIREEPKKPQAEPAREPMQDFFSDAWEPEYEEPIGEYTAPIPFQPQRKVQPNVKERSDPEKRYRQLRNRNYGAQQAGIFVHLLLFVLSALPAVLFALDVIRADSMKVYGLVQLLFMLVAALVGRYRLADAITELLQRKMSTQTLLLVTFLLCIVDTIVCLNSTRLPFCAVFNFQILMAQVAAYQAQLTELSQMDTLRKAQNLHAVVRCEDFYEGRPAFMTADGEKEDFLEVYDLPTDPQRVLNCYCLVTMLASVVLGILGAVRGGMGAGWQVMLSTMLLALPASALISQTGPARVLEKRLHKLGAVICGWQGVSLSGGRAVYPLQHTDIFPEGSVDLNGMKFPGKVAPERVLEFAASMISQEGGGLTDPFLRQVSSRGGHLHPVEDMNSYDGGLSALVDGAPTILGNMEFMEQMGVELPENTRLSQAVYIAIDGELAGVFAVAIKRSKAASGGLKTLCADPFLEPAVVSEDFLVTSELLRMRFSANTDRIELLEQPVRQTLSGFSVPEDAPAVALVSRSGLAQKAFPVTGARALKLASILGVVIHMLAGCLGLAAAVILAWVGGAALLSAGNVVLYSLLWLVPGWLITQWTRFI